MNECKLSTLRKPTHPSTDAQRRMLPRPPRHFKHRVLFVVSPKSAHQSKTAMWSRRGLCRWLRPLAFLSLPYSFGAPVFFWNVFLALSLPSTPLHSLPRRADQTNHSPQSRGTACLEVCLPKFFLLSPRRVDVWPFAAVAQPKGGALLALTHLWSSFSSRRCLCSPACLSPARPQPHTPGPP